MRGVYAITNVLTDTVYYGQSVNTRKRLRVHRDLLARGQGHNAHLQASWNKYGADAFVFAQIYCIPDGDLTGREKSCIDGAYGMGLRVFNLNDPEQPPGLGQKRTLEARARISASQLGHHRGLGRQVSAETRAKISVANSGKKRTLAMRENISKGHVGVPWSPVRRAAYVPYECSPETRVKLSIAGLGRKHSVESREKMSRSMVGKTRKPWSPARRAAWAARG